MKVLFAQRSTWVAGALLVLFAGLTSVSLQGCTDLDEELFGAVTPDNFYRTDAEILAAVAPIYAQLRTTLDQYHNLSQVSSDETVVPTRGSDWFDGGVWLATHRHTWTPSLGFLGDAWNNAYTGVARANVVLQTLDEAGTLEENPEIVAELRALRAFYYYLLMDLFGGVPIVGDDEYTIDSDNPPARESRAAVFAFLENELTEAREVLPDSWPASGYGRMTKGAADAILANMYVNAEVFTGDATAGGLNRGPARWQDAITISDRILNSGVYSLSADWFDNFSADNHGVPELIMVVAHLAEVGLGLNFPHRTLHYHQFTPDPWNGFATIAETYAAFDPADARRQIFLEGRAFNVETGEPVNNRQDEPLFFTPEIANIENASEGEGVRIFKFPADPNHLGEHNGNDYPFFRLAEIYLIKAEALNELQGPNQESIDLINTLRERVYDPPQPLQLADFPSREALRDRILDERLFELFYEAKRRQDLVRHDRFTEAWTFKNQSEPFRVLFPIPQSQRDANPNLTQNPGY